MLRLLAGAAACIVAVACLHHLALVPESEMSASRLVPAVALGRGLPIYAGPTGGPIIDFMYGPMAAVAFLPAALATTPATALAVAAVLNVLLFFGPMVWLHRRAAPRPDLALAAVVLFMLLVLRDPGLAFSALTIHADAPALGWGALACGILASAPPLGARRIAAAAAAAVLAVATKQTMAPIAIALVGVVWWRAGRRAALRLLAWMAGLGVVVGGICLLAFGPEEMLFNMVTLPARMPWYDEATRGRAGTIVFVLELFVRLAWLPAAVASALVGWRWWSGSPEPPRGDDPMGLLLGVALALVPAALLGGAKVGGYLNTFSVSTYFLAAAATIGLATVAGTRDRAGTLARIALGVGVAVLAVEAAAGPAGLATFSETRGRLAAWGDGPQDAAYRAAQAHAGELYLPWHPLATLLAEHRLDNNEIGAWNRELARVPIADVQWRAWLPPRLTFIAFRPPTGPLTRLPWPTRRLSEFQTLASLPELDGWIVRRRFP